MLVSLLLLLLVLLLLWHKIEMQIQLRYGTKLTKSAK